MCKTIFWKTIPFLLVLSVAIKLISFFNDVLEDKRSDPRIKDKRHTETQAGHSYFVACVDRM